MKVVIAEGKKDFKPFDFIITIETEEELIGLKTYIKSKLALWNNRFHDYRTASWFKLLTGIKAALEEGSVK